MTKEVVLFYCKLVITGKLLMNRGKHFKIGKTTQTLDTRFLQSYAGKYSKMFKIYRSSDLELIDWLERELIIYYQIYYQKSCDNREKGGGYSQDETLAKSAAIYLVL